MKKQRPLSENDLTIKEINEIISEDSEDVFYHELKVKEAVRRLKEELIQNLCIEPSHIKRTNVVINEIFGEELTKDVRR